MSTTRESLPASFEDQPVIAHLPRGAPPRRELSLAGLATTPRTTRSGDRELDGDPAAESKGRDARA